MTATLMLKERGETERAVAAVTHNSGRIVLWYSGPPATWGSHPWNARHLGGTPDDLIWPVDANPERGWELGGFDWVFSNEPSPRSDVPGTPHLNLAVPHWFLAAVLLAPPALWLHRCRKRGGRGFPVEPRDNEPAALQSDPP